VILVTVTFDGINRGGKVRGRFVKKANGMNVEHRAKRFAAELGAMLLLALGFAPLLNATTLARMSLSQMAGAADAVVRARCLTTASSWGQGSIWTVSQFEVLENFKGAAQQRSQIQVRLPGGRVGHITMSVEAVPRFQPGEEGVLFLEKTAPGTTR
jgi:hypothetical protein